MKKRKFVSLLVAVAGFCAFSTPALAKNFRIGLITPPSHVWTQAAKAFADDLKSETGGAHSAAVFDSGQLGNEAQMLQQLQTGALDMAFLTNAEFANKSPNFAALYAPYLVRDVQQSRALLRSETATRMLDELPRVAGVVGIGYGMGGMRQMLSRSAVNTAADLKGRKIRVTPLDPIRDFFMELGAAPTPLPLPAVYDALSNGQVDAIDMDLEVIMGMKFHDLADTILISRHMMWPMVGVVSARVWKTMSPEDQKQIAELMRKRLGETMDAYLVKEADWDKEVRATGKTVKDVDADFFRQAVDGWEKKWKSRSPALADLRQAAASLSGGN